MSTISILLPSNVKGWENKGNSTRGFAPSPLEVFVPPEWVQLIQDKPGLIDRICDECELSCSFRDGRLLFIRNEFVDSTAELQEKAENLKNKLENLLKISTTMCEVG